MTEIVFFDIDGTLTTKGNNIPESTIKAIAKLKANNIEPVIATGRPPILMADIAEKLNIDSYISMNGQYIVYKGDPVELNPLSISSVDRLVDFANEREDGLILCTEDELIINSRILLNPKSWYLKILKKLSFLVPKSLEMKIREKAMKEKIKKTDYENKEIYMVNLNVDRIGEESYRKNFDEFHFTRANEHAMDVINQGVSKARGIEKLLKYLKVEQKDTVAFGDGLNDLEMIEYVGKGIAMKNGFEELKAKADFVTDSVFDDGIMKALKKINLI
ncbi:MAG: Cof-type HAD-IIB family hydrolase [Atopostipes suicloacalis]|nr:Cof-type HAD-IIB family hydrolase [Atopostipes suicloacalis]MDN6730809.1 Cof-type HAD-IIB family hydrolase [Atopostipes suicloacalis]